MYRGPAPQIPNTGSSSSNMMMSQPSTPHSRFHELLEALRVEHEALQQEYGMLKHQKDDFDNKCTRPRHGGRPNYG